jgi:hypothetical protein
MLKHICALVLLTTGTVFAQDSQLALGWPPSLNPRLTLLKQYSFEKQTEVYANAANIAFDGDHIYLSSPDGIVYETSSLDSQSQLHTIFQPPSDGIRGIYVFDGTLYVLVKSRYNEPDHTVYQSTDQGRSFQPIDKGLACPDGACTYLPVSELYAEGNLIFVNPGDGENLSVSSDQGETYHLLSGYVGSGPCEQNPFEINGRTVLMGGECKLDQAFLFRGVLGADRLSWETPLADVQAPVLGNRKINVIQRKGTSNFVLVGAEGSMLRSLDGGRSFNFVFEYPTDHPYFPYTGTILFASGQRDLVLAGGFNKGAEGSPPYLGYATKAATKWTDIASLFGTVPKGIVTQLAEDHDGNIIALLVNVINKTVSVYQIDFSKGPCEQQ